MGGGELSSILHVLELNYMSGLDLSRDTLTINDVDEIIKIIPLASALKSITLPTDSSEEAIEKFLRIAKPRRIKCSIGTYSLTEDTEVEDENQGKENKSSQISNKKVSKLNRIDSLEKIDNKVKFLFLSEQYKKYNTKFFLTSNNKQNQKLVVKQLPHGFTLLTEENTSNRSIEDYSIYYAGRQFDVTNPSPIREPNIKLLKRISSHKAAREKAINLWQKIFRTYGNEIIATQDESSVHIKLATVDTYSDLLIHNEHYVAVAFKRNGEVAGGSFIAAGEYGGKEAMQQEVVEIDEPNSESFLAHEEALFADHMGKPILIHTSACMFGASFYGKDQYGNLHPLTSPRYRVLAGLKIVEILPSEELHPDEILSQKMLANLIPLMKVLSPQKPFEVIYHLPTDDYIIYGMDRILRGEMVPEVQGDYIRLVQKRAEIHKNYVQQLVEANGGKVHFFSTLEPLGLNNNKYRKHTLSNLFKTVGMQKYTEAEIAEKGKRIAEKLFHAIFEFMGKQDNIYGEIWRQAKDKVKFDEDDKRLLQINYVDYCAGLAVLAKTHQVYSLLQSQEKQILLGYKKLFSDFGRIIGLIFLPPFHVCMKRYNDMTFHLENYIEETKALLNSGIVEASLQQTAAIALDSDELAFQAAEVAYQLLDKEESKLKLNIKETILNEQIQTNERHDVETNNNNPDVTSVKNKDKVNLSDSRYFWLEEKRNEDKSKTTKPSSDSKVNLEYIKPFSF